MPKRNDEDEEIIFDDREDTEEDPINIGNGSDEDNDDDEGNEDLSLKILEKVLSRHDSKKISMLDLSGSGVVSTVIVNGGNSKSSKKMNGTNPKDAHKISIGSADQSEDKMVEDLTKGKDDDDEVKVERSAEPKAGEISNNMVLKKLLRGARYFDSPDARESCYSCGEQDHVTVNCPTSIKRKKPCFICGSLEHDAKQCSKGHDCYICKKGGHRAKDCPDKYKNGSKTAICLRCGDSGHDMILCKYEYSLDDLKNIQCYVCKSFGHLCCVEPGNSPLWAVSCYRCGQLDHIGLACGRYYEESTKKDFASSCFRCGEEGHFSRECPNSSSISTSHGRDSPSLCYRCNGVGHFARECLYSSQVSKRNRELSTPSHKSNKRNKQNSEHTPTPHESNRKTKNIENSEHISTPRESNGKTKKKKNKEILEYNSTPHESNGKTKKKKNKETSEHYSTPREYNEKMKKKKTHKGEHGEHLQTTPQKPKLRGGWMIDDLEDYSFQRGNIRRPRSPITPSGHNYHRFSINHTIW
ncbi:hypothetical protein EUTSA_v10020505mg [Eutrema salsugineum]|uniref:CCHC-type domain-containing protein n=1 Tax=Eutrema salsugineum TaxID=72664 RepID=V4LXJ4_EUTSA|nr:hypothetical protein EUTSA_v10020505mg [Eutrema salsugineum]